MFAATEGDRWFQRNKAALLAFDPDADLPMRLMTLYALRPRAVLEIGAANGFRLAAIRGRYAAGVAGVEVSAAAIIDGTTRYPEVRLVMAPAHALPFRESFDLVLVNFVFHWIDRSRLLASVAEVDRVVTEGGFLILGDFFPANLVRTRYHHLPEGEVYTYKQNYAGAFLASGLYHPVGLLTADHASKGLTPSAGEEDRTGVWLLRKSLHSHYLERPFPRD